MLSLTAPPDPPRCLQFSFCNRLACSSFVVLTVVALTFAYPEAVSSNIRPDLLEYFPLGLVIHLNSDDVIISTS